MRIASYPRACQGRGRRCSCPAGSRCCWRSQPWQHASFLNDIRSQINKMFSCTRIRSWDCLGFSIQLIVYIVRNIYLVLVCLLGNGQNRIPPPPPQKKHIKLQKPPYLTQFCEREAKRVTQILLRVHLREAAKSSFLVARPLRVGGG